jgi:nicotinamidase-related amidase
MTTAWKTDPGKSVYILIHADDFAIGNSMIRKDHAALRASIRRRCVALVQNKVPIVFTDLGAGAPPLPEYIAALDIPVKQIPNAMTGNLDQQILDLKQHLHKLSRRNRLIFAGGWRDACLRRTVNQVAFRAPRLIVTETGLTTATDATFQLKGFPDRPIKVAVDWENVF